MDNCNINIGAVKAKEIDGELYISCWNFSKALSEKEREISDLCEENDELRKQISELESELNIKGDANEALKCIVEEQRKEISRLTTERDKIMEENTDLKIDIERAKIGLETQSETTKLLSEKWFSEDVKEEPLPFSCDAYTDALFEKLEDLRERHQQDCVTINQLHVTIDTLVDRYAKLREMRGL